MTIHELLAKFEAKDLRVQYMHESIENANATTRGTKVTFRTDALTPSNIVADSYPIGVLVWIPRELWKAKMETAE